MLGIRNRIDSGPAHMHTGAMSRRRTSTVTNAVVRVLLMQVLINLSIAGIADAQPSLSTSYYSQSCPAVHRVVDQAVSNALQKNRGIVGGLLRLFFHDCFVRGCDASILIDSKSPQVAEKDGIGNINSLRGFEVIDDTKSALEKACPGVVSCADTLALVARAAIFKIGGPSWTLRLGRRDGNTSNAGETVFNLPPPFAKWPQLVNMFLAKGLNEKDMIVLSGAHTVGITHCSVIEQRLYNSTGIGGSDPNITASYAAQLRAQCPFSNGKSFAPVSMDSSAGNDVFDNNYFVGVRSNRGIFISDHALLENSTGAQVVKSMSFGKYPFFSEFANSMTKMSEVQVTLAPEGNVRKTCRVFNSALPPAPAPAPSGKSPTPSPSSTPIATPTPTPSIRAPAPVPISKSPAPVPSGKAPTPGPTLTPSPVPSSSSAPAPVPVAKAPAPGTISEVPAPVPTTKAPAPVPSGKAPTPTPALAPTPVPSSRAAPAPVPVAKAPAFVPVTPVPAPGPVSVGPAPVPTTKSPTPVPAGKAPTPVPAPAPVAQAPVPVSKAPAPVPSGLSPAPVPVAQASAPVPSANTPVPSAKASSPVPVGNVPTPVPVAQASGPVPSANTPVPSAKGPSPVPLANAPAPVPNANAPAAPAPAPVSKAPVPNANAPAAPAPVPISKAPAPAIPVAKGPAPVPTATSPTPAAVAS